MKRTAITILPFSLLFSAVALQRADSADYTNSLGMQFRNIPAGSFYMGSCGFSEADKEANRKRRFMGLSPRSAACPSGGAMDSDASDDEAPQHRVQISKGFQMGMYEVTLGQFKEFILGAGREDLLTDDFMKYNSSSDNAAACWVSWDDAQAFIQWLNNKEGGSYYRLPSEAEWEYAARAGTTSIYFWGNSASQAGKYAWYDKNSSGVQTVGRKQPNPWGLYDMSGNVWEWVQDWYDVSYYRNSLATDPQGPGSGRHRVIRGGGWYGDASRLRAADRDHYSPAARCYGLGFRLLRQPQ